MAKKVAAAGPVEGPSKLPDGWRWERLGSILPLSYGKALKAAERRGGSVPVYGSSGVAGSHDEALCSEPALIVGRKGSAGAVFYAAGPSYAIDTAYYCSTSASRFDLRLGYHLLSFLNLRKLDQSTAVPSLSRDPYNELIVPVPPDRKQSALAARIDELFAEIDNGEAALARARDDLATWRKALLKAAVTGELTADWRAANPSTETGADLLADILVSKRAGGRSGTAAPPDMDSIASDLPALPADWTWSTVGQVAHVTGGITKNAKRDGLPLRMPYLRVGNVYAGRVDLARMETIGVSEGEVERSAVKTGDLLIVEGNGSIDQIGRSAIWDGQIDPCLHQNHLIKVRIGKRWFADWLQLWLLSPWGRKELEAQASSTSGLHTLSISKVAGLRCPVPPVAELEASLAMVQRLAAEATAGADDMRAMKSTAAALRQSILAAAFRGELA